MKIHYLQHEPFESPGAILTWAHEHGHTLTSTMLYNNEPLPSIELFDMLVIMGGSMSVYDKRLYSWMNGELRFIESAIKENKAVLGICLGAQLIAHSLGAAVYKNKNREIGWFPISLTPEGSSSGLFKAWPDAFTMFHWHGDTFDVPSGAVRTAFSKATVNQAFEYGGKTVALQFHPETTLVDLELFLSNCGDDCRTADTFVQTIEQIREQVRLIPSMNKMLFKLLDMLEIRVLKPK
jgi:GMP synthase-like glutamine amidotransferase